MPVILVADDDFDSRELMRRRLVRRGYDVVEAPDGQSTMARLAEGPVDLVLLDHLMPDMTGLDVLDRIRSTPAIASVPVIMVTGKTFKEDVADAMSRGANAYVTKPSISALRLPCWRKPCSSPDASSQARRRALWSRRSAPVAQLDRALPSEGKAESSVLWVKVEKTEGNQVIGGTRRKQRNCFRGHGSAAEAN